MIALLLGRCWSALYNFFFFWTFQVKSTPSLIYSICVCFLYVWQWQRDSFLLAWKHCSDSCCERRVSDKAKHRTLAIQSILSGFTHLILINIVYLTPFVDFNSASILFSLSFSSFGFTFVNWKPNNTQVSETTHKWFSFLLLIFSLYASKSESDGIECLEIGACALNALHQNWHRKFKFMTMVFYSRFPCQNSLLPL